MSAYICNPEHIGILAAYAAVNDCAAALQAGELVVIGQPGEPHLGTASLGVVETDRDDQRPAAVDAAPDALTPAADYEGASFPSGVSCVHCSCCFSASPSRSSS